MNRTDVRAGRNLLQNNGEKKSPDGSGIKSVPGPEIQGTNGKNRQEMEEGSWHHGSAKKKLINQKAREELPKKSREKNLLWGGALNGKVKRRGADGAGGGERTRGEKVRGRGNSNESEAFQFLTKRGKKGT